MSSALPVPKSCGTTCQVATVALQQAKGYQQGSCCEYHHKCNSNICMCCSLRLKQRHAVPTDLASVVKFTFKGVCVRRIVRRSHIAFLSFLSFLHDIACLQNFAMLDKCEGRNCYPFRPTAQHHLINPLRERSSKYSQACADKNFIIMDIHWC